MSDTSSPAKHKPLTTGHFFSNERPAASGADHLQPLRTPKGMPRASLPKMKAAFPKPPLPRAPSVADALSQVKFDPEGWTDAARRAQLDKIRVYRTRNVITGAFISVFTAGVYWYTISATRQEDLDKLPLPEVKKE
ncbi:hypothetical protein M427DRAFT_64113 [Gonapodya prolifera JEL478]|uniref:Cytochrome c oxidase assembly factor 3 mitochondrial coiled-coil domain-containing protein n=1 Tax=Gonapodya prolifera (strain JEL478) TaxID=1344416 RepID=A0A138ZY93_GONPJ|nr:hypothetical protein M427DRAFT_64113 [Gonapodya prolifera JEL478]|eukprot:KXS09441.1 hypothetical protein M427DRAFT_64113 [Gonapodya prolifera JEL478]